MPRSPQAKAKAWGYDVERMALKALNTVWPELERTGASNQKIKDAPDLLEPGPPDRAMPLVLIVTKDKGQQGPMMVSLSLEDFLVLQTVSPRHFTPFVQVKGRDKTWIGSLYRGLKAVVTASYPRDKYHRADEFLGGP